MDLNHKGALFYPTDHCSLFNPEKEPDCLTTKRDQHARLWGRWSDQSLLSPRLLFLFDIYEIFFAYLKEIRCFCFLSNG